MRAIMVRRFGDPDVLEQVELPTPEPGPGQVLVEVEAVGVGWLDTQIRRGRAPDGFDIRLPYVPGSGVAGTVIAGDDQLIGTRVLTRAVGTGYGGGYADRAIAEAETAFPVPDGLGLDAAMAVLDDGSTALALLEKTPVHAGESVLVTPGVGGLGSLLVQLVRAAGATPIAAVRGAEKAALARGLGAETVDYGEPDWTTRVPALDVVFDGLGGEVGAAAARLLRDGGRFSGYGMASGAPTVLAGSERQRLSVVGMGQLPTFWAEAPRRVRQVLADTAAGRLTPVIGRTYPLAEAARAHADIEQRRFTGKLLLRP